MRHGGGEYEILPVIWHESDHSLKFSSPTCVSSRVLHGNSGGVFPRGKPRKTQILTTDLENGRFSISSAE